MITISKGKKSKGVAIGSLKLGQAFIFGNGYFIRARPEGDLGYQLAVNLLTGDFMRFRESDLVVPVNLELTEV